MLDNFNLEIEKRAIAEGSYIDAVVDIAEEKGMDVMDVADLLHENIREKLAAEFIKKNCVPSEKNNTSLAAFF